MSIHFRDQHQDEKGVALLLALFALILISAVGVAIVFMSTGETSIAANQRSNVIAWEAAKGGLEEMRSRMSKGDASYLGTSFSPIIWDENRPLQRGQVLYIVNPNGPGDVVAPSVLGNPYHDDEYFSEWGVTIESLPAADVRTVNSDMQSLMPGTIPSAPAYKWVRVTVKTEDSARQPISCNPPGACNPLNSTIPITFNGDTNRQILDTTNPTPIPTYMVYRLTSLAVLPNGTRRMGQYEVVYDVPLLIQSAINTASTSVTPPAQDFGPALNITGNAEPACSLPSLDGTHSSGPIVTPGGGNVTGVVPMVPNATFPYNIDALINTLKAPARPINSPGTGVSPPPAVSPAPPTTGPYFGPNAVLGVAPTVTPPSGAITTITAPGTPVVYYANGDLTLGGASPSLPSGQGILIVQGNLIIDIGAGFNYYGLIVVKGDITFIHTPPSPVTADSNRANIHGAIIAGGRFDATALSDLGGGISIRANACLINDQFLRRSLHIIASREVQ